jgi:hypothetical protein
MTEEKEKILTIEEEEKIYQEKLLKEKKEKKEWNKLMEKKLKQDPHAILSNCDEVKEVIKKNCPQVWENLKETKDNKVRYCKVCDEKIYHCETMEELKKKRRKENVVTLK